ncbi:MAG: HlyD family efflux transporter periplasmic adaptor subunit [Eubacteriales bacterium]|nr:HlyD family efflux transporter periplasmic adaptor subunit [Eubacteriales bacterium]
MKANKFKVVQGGRKRGNKIWRSFFIAGIAVLALFLLWNSLGYLALWAADVTVATNSEIVSSVTVQCFVLRNEFQLRSPGNGRYVPLVDNGARVRVGQDIARIEGPSGNLLVQAPVAGLILHVLDGFEGDFSSDSVLDLALVESVTRYLAKSPGANSVSQAKAGELVGVIVGNTGFKLLTAMSFHSQGQRQRIKTEDGLTYSIVPRQVIQAQDKFWALWDVTSLSDTLGMERVFSAELITQEQEAVLVPAKALHTRDGVQGVIVLFRGKPVFNPVEVVCNKGNEVGVKGLAHGQRVLTLPWWASLAKRWWLK